MSTHAGPAAHADVSLGQLLDTAILAARNAGEVLAEGQREARQSMTEKASLIDVVTQVDRDAEALVVKTISESFPHDGLVGEEGASREGTTGRRWIIDPLDGTANFIRGWKMSATSIGIEINGLFSVGVVYNPLIDELFSAAVGQGAWLNGDRLDLSDNAVSFEGAYVGMDGGYMQWARQQRAYVAGRLIRDAGEIRYGGSTALSLCHVAMGRLDAHVNIGSSLWDIAAGTVIAREAGLLVESTKPGEEPTPHHTIAARPELLESLRSLVAEAAERFPTGNSPSEY